MRSLSAWLLMVWALCCWYTTTATAARGLAAAPDCKKIHSACVKCANRRAPGAAGRLKTATVCTACAPDWRLRADSRVCDCAPGSFATSNTTCTLCPKGSYCPGGSKTTASTTVQCPPGLETIIPGAKSVMQCMTRPGFARNTTALEGGEVLVQATLCPVGTYNVGGNSMACTACQPGLTTLQEGTTASDSCVAPPGWYLRNDASAAKCPKGTYTEDYNRSPVCEACGKALSTAGDGSTSASDCKLAARGYFLNVDVGAQELDDPLATGPSAPVTYTAELCPVNTYQDAETSSRFCKRCPNGLMTQEEGSAGVELCMTPPGMELLPGASRPTQCRIGFWKAGWNMNPCVSCGQGILTAQPGAVSVDACFVPPGKGVITLANGAMMTVPCVQGSYGSPEPNHDIRRAKCRACPTAMATADLLALATAGSSPPVNDSAEAPALPGYTSLEDCLNKPGWGISALSGESEQCQVGFWSAGRHRQPCTQCVSGFTTLTEGSDSEEACVIQPGWEMDEAKGLPSPCQPGTFSTGGSSDSRFAKCTACPAGFTTQEDKATSASDCSVCMPGYGGQGCQQCPAGTFSSALSIDDCRPCPSGHTSAPGASSVADCLPVWPLAGDSAYSYLPLTDENAWVPEPSGASSEVTCRKRCTTSARLCIMFRYYYAGSNVPSSSHCMLLLALDSSSPSFYSRAAVGFKAFSTEGSAVDYAFYYLPEDVKAGEPIIGDAPVADVAQCTAACNKLGDECLLVRLTGDASSGYSCSLYKSVADTEYMTEYRISGGALLAGIGPDSISTTTS